MRIIKRMFASILTIAIALGDCGSMAVFAEETAVVSENSISENDTETPETTEAIETPEITELPALQIGWISDGETFPSADDTFSYNLPVSFETSNHLILFTNYTIEAIFKTEDGGSLEWSILRGEKDITPGSASLLNTADDWKMHLKLTTTIFGRHIIRKPKTENPKPYMRQPRFPLYPKIIQPLKQTRYLKTPPIWETPRQIPPRNQSPSRKTPRSMLPIRFQKTPPKMPHLQAKMKFGIQQKIQRPNSRRKPLPHYPKTPVYRLSMNRRGHHRLHKIQMRRNRLCWKKLTAK